MAKTMAEIQMDFSQAMRAAEELDQLAQKLDDVSNKKIESTFQFLKQTWTGEASQEFIKKGKILEEKIAAEGKLLKQNAEAIRVSARAIYNAEMEAFRLAQIREG